MFSLLRSNNNNKHQTSASHFAVCKVQYLDDAPAAGGPAREVEALEPARLSVVKPRVADVASRQAAKNGRHGRQGDVPTLTQRVVAPLPGSKLLKAWRAARK